MSEDTTELQQELEKVRKALKDANAEAKRYRESSEAFQTRISELESGDVAQVWKDKALKAEVKAALREKGVKDIERVLKVTSLEGVDLDDDGKLTGFEEKVALTKTEWPELFDAKRRVGGEADIFANGEPKRPVGTEAQVARIFGRV